MLLPGQLSQSTLGDVFGNLLRASATGVLSLSTAKGEAFHHVFLRAGVPRAVASDGPRIGELLISDIGVAEESIERAIALQRAGDGRLLGELVCERGADHERVRESVRRQTLLRLDKLFAMRDARLSFRSALFDDVVDPAWLRAAKLSRELLPAEFLAGRPRARARSQGPIDDRRAALALLDLEATASASAIRAAFKRKVLELHPDRAKNEADRFDRTARLAKLTSAYQRLCG